MVTLIFSLGLLSLLLTALASTPVVDQSRPNVIYRDTLQYYNNELVKGNTTESEVELLLNSAQYAVQRDSVRGDPIVEQTPDNITITGNVMTSTFPIYQWISASKSSLSAISIPSPYRYL